MNKKVVLAFSGGLDTSFCVKYLMEEKGLEVHSAIANTGGFSDEELRSIEQKAYDLGVKSHQTLDVTQDYYNNCIRFLIYGNILKNHTYPLSVSSERSFQAIAMAEYAKSIDAQYIAHGSTGAGNDQIRFDLVFQILAPEKEIITPIRDLKISRGEEIKFLKEKGVQEDWEKMAYSINQGLWGTSIGGRETLTSNETLPEEAYPSHPEKDEEEKLFLEFEKGELRKVNDSYFENPVDAIRKVESIGSAFAVGRGMHVGDTIIGIKGRVGFEAAAPMLIIEGHRVLEKHVLTKWQLYWKDKLSDWYGMLLHEGQYLDPVMRNIEKFMSDSQLNVTGKVEIRLHPYRFEVIGIESPYDMMKPEFAQYGEMNELWTGEEAKGFIKILANQLKIHQQVKPS